MQSSVVLDDAMTPSNPRRRFSFGLRFILLLFSVAAVGMWVLVRLGFMAVACRPARVCRGGDSIEERKSHQQKVVAGI